MWRGGFDVARWLWFRLAAARRSLLAGGTQTKESSLRFHIPLIEPDLQISRIRLSDIRTRLLPSKKPLPPRLFVFQYYRNYRISSSSHQNETGWTYQTTVLEWVDVGSDFNTTRWSDEDDPFESAAKAEEAGLAWARSKIDSGEICSSLKEPPKSL